MKITKSFFILIIVAFLGGCKERMDIKSVEIERDMAIVRDEGIKALASKKIFFGHASIGYNIINGIEGIKSNNNRFNKIHVQELKDIIDVSDKPGIYHAKNGKNGYPKSKIDAFKSVLKEKGLGNKLDIAFFKFCYVDIHKDSDIQGIFDYYVETIESLKKEFPRLKIVHITVPLYAHAWRMKGFIKNLIKGDISNVKRNQFNELLRDKYRGVDPIYDLARIESTYPDSTRSSFKFKSETYYSLAKQYTYDGGHLNEIGKYYAAKELLRVLAGISVNK
jgi:hypothetical protein